MVNQNQNKIYYDRMIAALGGWDRLKTKRIDSEVQNATDDFIMEYLLGDTKDISSAVKSMFDGFKTVPYNLVNLHLVEHK